MKELFAALLVCLSFAALSNAQNYGRLGESVFAMAPGYLPPVGDALWREKAEIAYTVCGCGAGWAQNWGIWQQQVANVTTVLSGITCSNQRRHNASDTSRLLSKRLQHVHAHMS